MHVTPDQRGMVVQCSSKLYALYILTANVGLASRILALVMFTSGSSISHSLNFEAPLQYDIFDIMMLAQVFHFNVPIICLLVGVLVTAYYALQITRHELRIRKIGGVRAPLLANNVFSCT